MAQPAKGRTTRKAREKLRPREAEYASYVIRIEDWEWAFSSGLGNRRFNDGPYMDFRHLHLRGELIAPSGIKTETMEVPTDDTTSRSPAASEASVSFAEDSKRC